MLSATVAGTIEALGTDGKRLADYYRLEVCAYVRLCAGVQACHVTVPACSRRASPTTLSVPCASHRVRVAARARRQVNGTD